MKLQPVLLTHFLFNETLNVSLKSKKKAQTFTRMHSFQFSHIEASGQPYFWMDCFAASCYFILSHQHFFFVAPSRSIQEGSYFSV